MTPISKILPPISHLLSPLTLFAGLRTLYILMTLKRALEESSSHSKPKKSRTDTHSKQTQLTTTLLAADVDFPRGGGTSFTPLEVKNLRAEAVKEANAELFEVIVFW